MAIVDSFSNLRNHSILNVIHILPPKTCYSVNCTRPCAIGDNPPNHFAKGGSCVGGRVGVGVGGEAIASITSPQSFLGLYMF